MTQILAIFKKDTRRFWPEILVSLAITVAFAIVYPNTWRAVSSVPMLGFGRFFGSASPMGVLAGCLVVLIPISWWILVARLIHGERLVGDNQFWLTRPYEWPKFLAAKLLFLVVFLYLPFFLAQSALLAEGGFRPLSYLPGLLYNLLLMTGVFVLPLSALSAITTGFGRMTLVILGVILFIGGVALLNSYLPSSAAGSVPSPLADNLSFYFITCGCAAVVVVQYALRKVRLAWVLVALVAVLLSGLALFDPDRALIERAYPAQASTGTAFVQYSYAAKGRVLPTTSEANDKGVLDISVPVQVTGVAEGYAAIPVALKTTIEGPDGARWESVWQAIYNERDLPGTQISMVSFQIRRAEYDKFKSTPVTLRVAFAIDEAKAAAVKRIPIPEGEFSVPGFGICTPQKTLYMSPQEIVGIACRSALRQPQLTYVTVSWTEDDCSVAEPEREEVIGAGWTGSFATDPAEFGITSVWQTPLGLSNRHNGPRDGQLMRPHQICPGSPVTFTAYDRIGKTQVGLTVPNFHLPEIARFGVYGIAVTR